MNPRERMSATLNHQKPDQVPIALGWRPEVMEAVQKHYNVDSSGEVARILGADMTRSVSPKMHWAPYEKRLNGTLEGAYASLGPVILHDERTFEDCWGVVQRVGADGKYLEWVSGPFAGTDDLDSIDWTGEEEKEEEEEIKKKKKKKKNKK